MQRSSENKNKKRLTIRFEYYIAYDFMTIDSIRTYVRSSTKNECRASRWRERVRACLY